MSVPKILSNVPNDVVCYPMTWSFENVVGVSLLLGIQPPVIATSLEHLHLLPKHHWLRLRSLAVAKLNLVLCAAEEPCSVNTA